MASRDRLFCLVCGQELAACLQHVAALCCHDCRDAGVQISFELAWLAREASLQASVLLAERPAA
jgi:hypothetical protein